MYYDIVKSGKRISGLRTARGMTRQQFAELIGISVDAMRKIELGINGAKIDTLISIADMFEVSLDYLVCGGERKMDIDNLLAGLKENEIQFIKNMILSTIDNMKLLTE
ncbi:MAG: helix-turn-helix transcriptional regulator [Lachnospiraceae bacterium]|nr:helix-turn-helix transcriptional regulator [Lachnospiraceae bacterium]